MAQALLERASFAAGEVSPTLYARRELATHAIGVARCDNLIALLEGCLTRAPGTRFVLPYKTESQAAQVIRFRHTPEDGYLLVLNGGVMRVLKNGGFLESSPGVIYELAIPWAAADLPNIRAQQVENVVYISCTGFQTRVLTRGSSHIDWTLSLYLPAGGPVKTQNVDTGITITASAVTGTGITLNGTGTSFSANDVGGVFRLDEPDLTKVPQWTPSETLNAPLSLIGAGLGTNFGDATGVAGLAAAFNGVTNAGNGSCAATPGNALTSYVGKDYGAGNEKKVAQLKAFGSNNLGFYSGTDHPFELRLYGKNGTAPANGTDGVELGRITFTDTGNESNGRIVYSNDAQTAWRYVWAYLKGTTGTGAIFWAEVEFYQWTSPTPANLRRYNGRVYAALNDGDTGTNPPTHDEGDARSGNFNINWRFLHNTYGMVRVTGFTSTTVLTGDVISRLPESVVDGPTYRFWPPAWSPREGWPDRVGLTHEGRLIFGRKNEFWITRPSSLGSLEVLNITGDAADPDSAIAARIRPRKSELPWIEWFMASAGVVIMGLRDGERILRAPNLFDPLVIDKTRLIPGSAEGSAPHDPADVDSGLILIGRSRRRLHYADFDNLNVRITTSEITKTARHILAGKAASLAWQRDPHRILWIACQDGSLRALTFMPEDKVVAFARRSLKNGFVEWVAAVPSADESADEVYLGVRRTINGATRRYVERLQDFFDVNADQASATSAWFVDSGLELINPTAPITGASKANPCVITSVGHPFSNGQQVRISDVLGMVELNGVTATVANKTANTYELAGVNSTAFGTYTSGGIAKQVVTSVSGLSHLALETVRIFADGAQQGDAQVNGAGAVTLIAPANRVLVGLPLKYFLRTLPFDLETPAGSTKGQVKSASHVVLETVYSAGGTIAINPGVIGVNGGTPEPITGTGSLDYGAEVPLLTELKRIRVNSKSGPRCFVEITGDNALPVTIAGIHPELKAD